MNPINLYMVSNQENLYGERVGSLVWEDKTRIQLDLGDDSVIFNKNEVEQII